VRLPTALVVQHTPTEPPGRLAGWLLEQGVLAATVTPYDGSVLPADPAGYAALVVLGGPIPADGSAAAPWLPATRDLLRAAVTGGVPTLAICLGAQLLATVFGGRVRPGAAGPEYGPALVAKRDVAAADELFGPVPLTPDVLQWHTEGITDLPPTAVLLASSPRYPVQAFRYGELAWGLQFHIETTPQTVARWVERDAVALTEHGVDPDRVLARLDEVHADLAAVWRPFTARFAEVVQRADRAHATPPGSAGPARSTGPAGGECG
jgi:GMP synthase-like glutamine amidotransferase